MIFDLADILPALPEMVLATLALALVLVAAYGGALLGTVSRWPGRNMKKMNWLGSVGFRLLN